MLKEAEDRNAIVPAVAKENEPPKAITKKDAINSTGAFLKQRKRKVEVDHDAEPVRKRTKVSASTQRALDRANRRDAEQERAKEEQQKLKRSRETSEDEEERANKRLKENKEEKKPTLKDLNRIGRFTKKATASHEAISTTQRIPEPQALSEAQGVREPQDSPKTHVAPELRAVPKAQAGSDAPAVPKRQAGPIATSLTKKGVARKVVKKPSSPTVDKPTKASPTYKGVANYVASQAQKSSAAEPPKATKAKGSDTQESTKEATEKAETRNGSKASVANKKPGPTYKRVASMIASNAQKSTSAEAMKVAETKQAPEGDNHTKVYRSSSPEEGEIPGGRRSSEAKKTPETMHSPGGVKLTLENCPTPRANTPVLDNDSTFSLPNPMDGVPKTDEDSTASLSECPTPRAGTPVLDDDVPATQHGPVIQTSGGDEDADLSEANCPTPRASSEAQDVTENVQTAQSLEEARAQETADQDQDVDQV